MTQDKNQAKGVGTPTELVQKLQGKEAKPWLCKDCQSVLGVLSADGETIRIKYKDLFVYIAGGSVTVFCRTCGLKNTISDQA